MADLSIECVIVHAWRWEQSEVTGLWWQEYSDPGCDPVHGWTAYVRYADRGDNVELGDMPWRYLAVALGKQEAEALGIPLCVED